METDTIKIPGMVALEGVTGSRAYGLDTPESDVDLKGVYVAPTRAILSIFPIQDTINRTQPDVTYHEVGKFISLALAANPTIMEMLFLEDYTVVGIDGDLLVRNRHAFLSQRVKNSYGGYAMQQIKRLQRRGDGSFSADTKKRKAKHARHCFRLLQQGRDLLLKGTLTVKVPNREELFALGEMSDEELVARFEKENEKFLSATESSILKPEPDFKMADNILQMIRERHYVGYRKPSR